MNRFVSLKKFLPALLGCGITCCCTAAEYIPAWEKFDNWQWGDAKPQEIILPSLKARPAINKHVWPGADEFSAVIDGGWTDDGLVFFADVTDSDVGNDHPDTELWRGDACEFFITSASDRPFAVGNRLQAVIAPPDSNGMCRVAYYGDNTVDAQVLCKASGEITENGYTIVFFVPWEALGGNAENMIMHDGFRFNMIIDDFEANDSGSKLSLNGSSRIFAEKEASPLFTPVAEISKEKQYDGRIRFNTGDSTLFAAAGATLHFDTGTPCSIVLKDGNGQTVAEESFSDGKASVTVPDTVKNTLLIKTIVNGTDLLIDDKFIANIDLASAMISPATPSDRVMGLGILNALECEKTVNYIDDIENELMWRIRKYAGEDISDAPGILRYLNLMGDPTGLIQTGIARGRVGTNLSYATLTAQWGGIPVVYADITLYANEADAVAAVRAARNMRHELPVSLPEADEVYAGRGLTLVVALSGDLDPEYMVCVTTPDDPYNIVRATPAEALKYSSAKVFAVHKGAPEKQIRMMKDAGLQEISLADAEKYNGPVIRLGIEGLNIDRDNAGYQAIHYGIEDDVIVARKGNLVVKTAYAIPETGLEVVRAVFDCKPISALSVDIWRQRRLEFMGGDLPELRTQGRLVRTGETHSHTLYSDGCSSPASLMTEAIASGLDFWILTDHDTVTGALRFNKVLQDSALAYPFVIGTEITANYAYHLNAFPLTKAVSKEDINLKKLVEDVRGQGGVIMLNHPMTYGINLRHQWYDNLEGYGIDAVERNLSQLENWRQKGYEAAFLGSTDTHMGIFGHWERSAFLQDEVTGEAIAADIIAKKCAMIAPDLPGLVYGNEEICKAVRAALGDRELPEYHEKRLDKVFENFDLDIFLANDVTGEDMDYYRDGIFCGDRNEVITTIPERI